MPDQYAVALIVQPNQAYGDRCVVPWPYDLPDEPTRQGRGKTQVSLIDGPHDELRDAQLAFLRRIGAL